MKIYLYSRDGHRDSIELGKFATSVEEIKKMAIEHDKEMLGMTIDPDSFHVDEEIQKITYKYMGEDYMESGRCYYMILEPFNRFT